MGGRRRADSHLTFSESGDGDITLADAAVVGIESKTMVVHARIMNPKVRTASPHVDASHLGASDAACSDGRGSWSAAPSLPAVGLQFLFPPHRLPVLSHLLLLVLLVWLPSLRRPVLLPHRLLLLAWLPSCLPSGCTRGNSPG
mmetsp:Transcript_48267/g.108723  ORF Transcript_48267/g.108723 Transcript_48267/m.108723 type:complete len:143 (-) Transcript_48267:295-723(-)